MTRTIEDIDADIAAFNESVYHKDYYGDGPRKRLLREKEALIKEMEDNE